MTQTITRSYESYEDALVVVTKLENAGVASADISLVASRVDDDDSTTGEAAGIGGLAGGAAGLLAGLGMIAIPGIGPVVAAGWLVTTAAGAAVGALAGGVISTLTTAGVDEIDAHYYAETVRRGGSVVSVRATDEQVPTVEAIMDGATPIDMYERRAAYEREGWTQFDENAPPHVRPSS
jgi:hypothetical protein